jgi:polysaccharide deacetylase 2 family uncharacterized protein YibQ
MPDEDAVKPEGESSPKLEAVAAAPTWLNLMAGFSFVATVAVLAVILLVRFTQDRPVNIEAPSAELGHVIEGALTGSLLPPSGIHATASIVESEHGHRWTYHKFEVTVPPRLDIDGIANLIGDKLVAYNLSITRERDVPEGARHLKIWMSNYEVASLMLNPGAPENLEQQDWRPESTRLANAVRLAFDGLGIPDAALFQRMPELREDSDALWGLTKFEARAPKLPAGEELAAAIQQVASVAQVSLPDVSVRAGDTPSGDNGVLVEWRGRTVVEVALVPTGDMSMGPLAYAPMDAQPNLFDLLNGTIDATSVPVAYPSVALPEGAADGETMVVASVPTPPGPRSKADASQPRVALVLDDGGYGGEVTERVLALDNRVTLAILPNTPDGAATATRATEIGFEVILHMPMQTDSTTVKPFPGQLNVDMGSEQIAQLTTDAMAQVPGAVGVNNHTGSKFTANADQMALFLDVVKQKGWFFLDSKTGPDSKGFEVAKEMGIPSTIRDVFLDDVAEAGEIKRQWAEMVRIARKTGRAVAIGHFRALTLDVIEEELPKLEGGGITLVPLSELLE